MVCSQPKRALRRQARIDHLQDPWVRLSDSSPEELSGVQHIQHPHSTDNVQPEICSKPTTMIEEEIPSELNDKATISDPLSDMAPSEIPPGAKKGPPVAPKPAWFRQSLRKIRDEQDQKKQDKPSEQKPHVGFSRSFSGRTSSTAVNLSIKQKINSFETFSSPGGSEMRSNTRPVATSSSLPLVKEPRSHSVSNGDFGKGKDVLPEEIQAEQSSTISAISPSTSEDQTTIIPSGEEPLSSQDLNDPLLSDLDSESYDPRRAPVHHDKNTLPSQQETKLETEELSGSTETTALPPTASLRLSEAAEKSPPEVIERAGTQSVVNQKRGLDGESLVKILTFSNQVICRGLNCGIV